MSDLFSIPRVGLALFVVRGNKILLHKRLSRHSYGTWACPGGHLDLWESFEEGALRELKEEAGDVEVSSPELITVVNTPFPEEKKHYVCIFLVSDWISGEAEIMEPDKCGGWEWFDIDNLPDNVMNKEYADIIKAWQHEQILQRLKSHKWV